MIVKYSCSGCGIEKVEVKVPERLRSLDIAFWLEQVVARHIGDDHLRRSPNCQAKTMQDLMIPISEEDDFIGQKKDDV